MSATTEMVMFKQDQYPALAGGQKSLDMIRANLAGETLTPADLRQIRVPAGGATSWTIINSDGTETAEKIIDCIILGVIYRRAYWENPTPTGMPPDCVSTDIIHGLGKPGGVCKTCPFAQWKSAVKQDGSPGLGQRCTQRQLMFVLRQGSRMPEVLVIPPGSFKSVKGYKRDLPVPLPMAITRFTLEKNKNKEGITYAMIAPKMVGKISDEERKLLMDYAQAWKTIFEQVQLDQDANGDSAEVTEV